MTGREVYNKTYDVNFYNNVVDFLEDKRICFDSNIKAIEFLTLYCILLFTGEFPNHDDDKILEKYNFINSKIQRDSRICSKEFLSNFSENINYVIRDKVVFMLQ